MIVDCHTHFSCGGRKVDIAEYLTAAEPVEKCIVIADIGKSEEINAKLADSVKKYHGRLEGFAFLNPLEDDVSEKAVNRMTLKIGLKGAVVYCAACKFHPAHTMAMQFYESAQALKLPVFFHNAGHLSSDAVLDYAQPYLLDEIARTFPNLKMIIGSMGMPFFEQTISIITKHKNVYADLSIKPSNVWQVYNIIRSAYEREAMDKLLFGSGYPLGNARDCIEVLLGFNKLLTGANLPDVPRQVLKGIIERDTLEILEVK
jgi:predicted TIM-barrel fold metal-dependent hydrolase